MLSGRSVLRSTVRSATVVARSLRVARPTVIQRFASAKAAPTEVSSILEERIRGVSEEANLNETGRVLSVGYVFF
jgi:F-type H+-transporting ATPase subunit alpha